MYIPRSVAAGNGFRMADDLADALFEGMSEEEVKAFMEQVEAMGQRARMLNQRQERLKAQEINK